MNYCCELWSPKGRRRDNFQVCFKEIFSINKVGFLSIHCVVQLSLL